MSKINYKIKNILIIFLIIFIVNGCSKKSKNGNNLSKTEKKIEEVVIPIETTTVKQGKIIKTLEVSGDIKTDKDIKVSTKIPGKVVYVAAKEGDYVRKGQTLIKLEANDLLAQIKQAEAGVMAAKARLNMVLTGARPQEKKQVENTLTSAQAMYDSALKDYQRMEILHNHGSISNQQFEQVKLRYDDAKAKLDSVKQQLTLVDEGARIEEKQAAQAQLVQAQAQVQYLKIMLSYTHLSSPCNCLVSGKMINVGEMAAPGYPLLTLVDNNNIFFEAQVSEKDNANIKAGQEVIINIDGIPNRNFLGEVTKIYPSVDMQSRVFKCKIIFKNKSYLIKSGMFARGDIILQKKTKALLLSKDAVYFKEETPYVFLVKDNVVKQKNISLGIGDKNNFEILWGLNLNDRVVVLASPDLKDGSKIKVVNGK